MSTITVYSLTAALFILIFATGIWTSSLGRPLNIVVNTVHKLLSVGTGVLIVVTLAWANRAAPFGSGDVAMIVVSAVCFGVTVATGGVLSSDKRLPGIVLLLHKIFPVLSALSSGYTLYTLLGR